MNLAVADMSVATFFAPRYLFRQTFTHPDGMTGTILCKLLTAGNLGWVGGGASVFTLVAIAIERYYAVMRPCGRKFTDGKLKVRLCLILSYVVLEHFHWLYFLLHYGYPFSKRSN